MEELITLLILLGIWLVPNIIKAVAGEKKKTVTPPPYEKEREPEKYGPGTFQRSVREMQQTATNPPNKTDYFTYETIEPEIGDVEDSQPQVVDPVSQIVDNEIGKMPVLDFDEKELYKGVIYSEILKRKFS
jgi:hypothetical protein